MDNGAGALEARSPAERPVPAEGPAPGIGLAGTVMCPLMSVVHPAPCLKGGCELWVELQYGQRTVARCALAWLPILSTETRQAIARVSEEITNAQARPMSQERPEQGGPNV